MSRFASILDTKIEDTPKVPLTPVGSYIFQVSSDMNVQTRGEFEIIEFQVVGVQSVDDTVDMEELTRFGGAKNARLRVSFIFPLDPSEEAKFVETQNRLKRFLREHLSIGEDEAPTFKSALAQVKGRAFIGEVTHRQDRNDPETFYAEIKKTMPVE